MQDLFIKATMAYAKVCKNGTPVCFPNGERHMLAYQEPSRADSEIGRKYVYLRNSNGDLCRYSIRTAQIVI